MRRTSHWGLRACVCFLILQAPAHTAAQSPRVITATSPDAPAGAYRLTLPASTPQGLLVLFGNWGATYENSFWQRLGIEAVMAQANIATLEINNTPWRQNYFNSSTMERLDSIVAKVIDTHRLPPGRVVMGGYELGGGAALKYAIRCERSGCTASTKPLGVMAVNPILDYTRFWKAYSVYMARPGGIPKDRAAIMRSIERELGGTPETNAEAYHRESIYVGDAVDGGAARYLRNIAVLQYIDPDIAWLLDSSMDDYFSSNLIDNAGLHLFLKRNMNARSELVAYSTKAAMASRPPDLSRVVNPQLLREWAVALFK